MSFNELLQSLITPGDDGPSETVYDDLRTSYDDAVGGGEARLSEANALNAELVAEVARLKGINFDLMMTIKGDATVEPDEPSVDADDDISDDDIFGEDK